MKRIIATILTLIMLFTLSCIPAFALDANSVTISFTCPSVNDEISLPATIPAEDGVFCNGYNFIDKSICTYNASSIQSIATLDNINSYIDSYGVSSEVYENTQYLLFFTIFSPEIVFSNTTQITAEDVEKCETLLVTAYEEGCTLYGYLVFTPKSGSSGGGNVVDPNPPASDPSDPSEPSDSGDNTNDDAHEVTVTYKEAEKGGVVRSVNIVWDSMAFTYTPESGGTWNPSEHNYMNKTPSSWSFANNGIKVTNHSNTGITARFSYTPANGFSGISAAFVDEGQIPYANKSITIPTAENTSYADAPNKTVYLKLSGDIEEIDTASAVCGTVTVTIQ